MVPPDYSAVYIIEGLTCRGELLGPSLYTGTSAREFRG